MTPVAARSRTRRTKIVCTIGPATSSQEAVDKLVEAGMDGARLNFSHGAHEEHAERCALVRESQRQAQRPLALIADLQGPKLRLGRLEAARTLVTGDEVVLVAEEDGDETHLPVSPGVLPSVLQAGPPRADRRRPRASARRRGRRRQGARDRARRRGRLHGEGRECSRRSAADSLGDRQGQEGSRLRLDTRRGLRRALVRALGQRRPPPARAAPRGGLRRADHREDREGRGARRPRRDPPPGRLRSWSPAATSASRSARPRCRSSRSGSCSPRSSAESPRSRRRRCSSR